MATRNGLVFGVLLATGTVACTNDEGPPVGPGQPISVFTHNLYLGSDIMPLISIPSPAAIPGVTATLWAHVQASNFPERARVLADQIVTGAPDLVALQEVTLYRRQVPSDFEAGAGAPPNATEVVLDFLDTLMSEIATRGGTYHVVGEAPNVDAEVPVSDGAGGVFDLRLTDRDVILARDGVETGTFVAQNYDAKFAFVAGGSGGAPIALTRGFSHVDATIGDAHFTFANTHLEIQSLQAIQTMQAGELIAGLGSTPDPVLLLGDFNSSPGMNSYPLLAAKYHDAFDAVTVEGNGFTCCQAEDLRNPESAANERIDLVLYRGRFRVTDLSVTGTDPATGRTPDGLWPSDHFGVLSHLELVP